MRLIRRRLRRAAAPAPATGRDDLAGPPRGGADLVCGASRSTRWDTGRRSRRSRTTSPTCSSPRCCRCCRRMRRQKTSRTCVASSRPPRRSAPVSASWSDGPCRHVEPCTDRQIAGALWVAADDLPSMPAHQQDVARYPAAVRLLPRAHRARQTRLLVEALARTIRASSQVPEPPRLREDVPGCAGRRRTRLDPPTIEACKRRSQGDAMESPQHGPAPVRVIDEIERIDRLEPLDAYQGQVLGAHSIGPR